MKKVLSKTFVELKEKEQELADMDRHIRASAIALKAKGIKGSGICKNFDERTRFLVSEASKIRQETRALRSKINRYLCLPKQKEMVAQYAVYRFVPADKQQEILESQYQMPFIEHIKLPKKREGIYAAGRLRKYWEPESDKKYVSRIFVNFDVVGDCYE